MLKLTNYLLCVTLSLYLFGCNWSKSKPFIVTFDETLDTVQQLKIGAPVYRGGIAIGEVVSKTFIDDGLGVGISLDHKYRTALTRDSKFFVDLDKINFTPPGNMAVFVLVPPGSKELITPGEVLTGGVNSSIMWLTYKKEYSMEKNLGSMHNDLQNNSELYRNFLEKEDEVMNSMREFVYDMSLMFQEADWHQIGRDIEDDMIHLQQQVNAFVNGNTNQDSLASIQAHIQALMDRVNELGDTPETKRLMATLHHMQDKLRQDLSK